MKYTFTILSVCFIASTAIAQVVNIPNANFKSILVGNTSINTNQDTEIQVSEALAFTGTIDCNSQNIADLTGIEAFVGLTELLCNNNQITSLDVSQNTALTSLVCGGNQLTSLDVSQNTALTLLSATQNQLTSLNVNQNTALTTLELNGNQLSSLDVSQNTGLTSLRCNSNQLTSLDISQNTDLTLVDCNGNQITSLNVGQNRAMVSLDCSGNQITSLDVSQCVALTQLRFQNNQLTSLNVANGNNANFVFFWSVGNPNLTCIEVDDAAYSTSNWTISTFNFDAGSSFDENCTSVGVTETAYQAIDIYPNPTKDVVRWNGIVAQTAEVFDHTGRSVLLIAQPNGLIDISELPLGIYVLKLFTEEDVYTSRTVKQ